MPMASKSFVIPICLNTLICFDWFIVHPKIEIQKSVEIFDGLFSMRAFLFSRNIDFFDSNGRSPDTRICKSQIVCD